MDFLQIEVFELFFAWKNVCFCNLVELYVLIFAFWGAERA